jgi:hypothetical protein
MKIVVCIPSYGMVPFPFARSLAAMMAVSTEIIRNSNHNIDLIAVTDGIVHASRQMLAVRAVELGATHVLWIDADMTFPADALLKLLTRMEANPDADIIGVNYSNRSLPPQYVALKVTGRKGGEKQRLETTEDSHGLEEVEALGLGFCLMTVEALTSVSAPVFEYKWDPGTKNWVGEDVLFCERAREAGMHVYVDHDLSKECGHVGAFTFTLDHVDAFRTGVENEAERMVLGGD